MHKRAALWHISRMLSRQKHSHFYRLENIALKTTKFLLKGAKNLFLVLGVLWGSLAIHYSNLPWAPVRTALGMGFFGFAVWALWISKNRRMKWAFGGLFALVVIGFMAIRPSHDRPWRDEVAVMPRAIVNGNKVTFTGVRDFEFRTRHDFTPRYIERTVSLSHLTSVDFFISYWKMGPIGHTFLSFNFDNAEPVCISIETRPEVGESFNPIGSLFKQFELIYLVGQERDLVGSRTKHRSEDVFLYRIHADRDAVRKLFMVYVDRINRLANHAEWYHLISNSCTVNIVRYANKVGRLGGWELRHLLNGWIDQYLYRTGRIVPAEGMDFAEYRRRAHINDASNAVTPGADFSKAIRANLP